MIQGGIPSSQLQNWSTKRQPTSTKKGYAGLPQQLMTGSATTHYPNPYGLATNVNPPKSQGNYIKQNQGIGTDSGSEYEPLTKLAPFLGIGGAVTTALSGLISGFGARKRLDNTIDAAKKLIKSDVEIRHDADEYGDAVTTQGVQQLNEGAYSTRGLLNPETVRTMGYAKLAGQRAATEIQSTMQDRAYNQSIREQIVELKSQRENDETIIGNSLLSAVGAGTQLYMGGVELDEQREYNSFQMDPNHPKNKELAAMFSQIAGNVWQNGYGYSTTTSSPFAGNTALQQWMNMNNPNQSSPSPRPKKK